MLAIIGGPNTKIFYRIIQSLARIGSDLYIEAHKHGIVLKTISSTNTSIGFAELSNNFFYNYQLESTPKENDKDFNKLRLSMKTITKIFKNLNSVITCEISTIPDTYKIKFKFNCRLEVVKTYNISLLEYEELASNCLVDIKNSVNKITARHKLLTEVLGNFNPKEKELTFIIKNDIVIVRNYLENSLISRRIMRSYLKLIPSEFECYKIQKESPISFSLKEFNSAVHFAAALNRNLDMYFNMAGDPLVSLIDDGIRDFKFTLISATVDTDEIDETIDDIEFDSNAAPTVKGNNNTNNQLDGIIRKVSLKQLNNGNDINEAGPSKRLRIESSDDDVDLFNFDDRNTDDIKLDQNTKQTIKDNNNTFNQLNDVTRNVSLKQLNDEDARLAKPLLNGNGNNGNDINEAGSSKRLRIESSDDDVDLFNFDDRNTDDIKLDQNTKQTIKDNNNTFNQLNDVTRNVSLKQLNNEDDRLAKPLLIEFSDNDEDLFNFDDPNTESESANQYIANLDTQSQPISLAQLKTVFSSSDNSPIHSKETDDIDIIFVSDTPSSSTYAVKEADIRKKRLFVNKLFRSRHKPPNYQDVEILAPDSDGE